MTGRADSYIPLYIGDYLADTTHLSTVEHGAYLLLLFHYWNKGSVHDGGGLPDDDRVLASIVKLTPGKWKKISSILRAFFVPVLVSGKAMLLQKRMEDVLSQISSKYAKKRAALAAANAAKKQGADAGADAAPDAAADANPPSSPPSLLSPTPPNNTSSPSSPQTKPPYGGENARGRALPPPDATVLNEPNPDFDEFWDVFPVQKCRDEAVKAWLKAITRTSPAVLLAAAKRYAAACKLPGAPYPKYPQNWLNEARWLDATGPPNGAEKLDAATAAALADKADRLLKRGKYAEH